MENKLEPVSGLEIVDSPGYQLGKNGYTTDTVYQPTERHRRRAEEKTTRKCMPANAVNYLNLKSPEAQHIGPRSPGKNNALFSRERTGLQFVM